jgi:hypothetical protein
VPCADNRCGRATLHALHQFLDDFGHRTVYSHIALGRFLDCRRLQRLSGRTAVHAAIHEEQVASEAIPDPCLARSPFEPSDKQIRVRVRLR